MNILLVGAPNSGKGLLGSDIANQILKSDFRQTVGISTGLPPTPSDMALGAMADYRTEVFLASYRTHLQRAIPMVYKTSLIDSAAYTTMRLAGMTLRPVASDEEVNRWQMTLAMVMLLMRDSLQPDLVFYLPQPEQFDTFEGAINATLREILNELDLDYTSLEGQRSENTETAVRMISDVLTLSL